MSFLSPNLWPVPSVSFSIKPIIATITVLIWKLILNNRHLQIWVSKQKKNVGKRVWNLVQGLLRMRYMPNVIVNYTFKGCRKFIKIGSSLKITQTWCLSTCFKPQLKIVMSFFIWHISDLWRILNVYIRQALFLDSFMDRCKFKI